MKRVRALVAVIAAAALMSGVGSAVWADSLPTDTNSQTFTTSAGGWSSESEYVALCGVLPGLLCAAINNSYVATGGVDGDGDGYISAGFGALAALPVGQSISVWTSPEFTYNGVSGDVPDEITFAMAMRTTEFTLLDLGSAGSSYKVDLVGEAGPAVSVIASGPMSEFTNWTALPTVSIDPSLLVLGQSYQIQITTTIKTTIAEVGAGGSIDYDNISLTTSAEDEGEGGSNGGSEITTPGQLTDLVENTVLPGAATVTKKAIKVKLKCPKSAKPLKCKIAVKALAKGKKSKAATKAKTVKLKAGKKKVVKLKLKKKFVKKFANKKKAFLKTTVKVGKVRVTVVKKVKLKK